MPLTVGGGIREVDDMRNPLLAGADKVSVNSAAVKKPELLSEGAARFGVQCIVLAIDVHRRENGWEVYVNGGRSDWDRRGRNGQCARVELGVVANPADKHGRGWDASRLRILNRRADCRSRRGTGHRFGRRGKRVPFCRGSHRRQSRCGAGRIIVPLRQIAHS